MWRAGSVVLVALAGCGRIGFEPTGVGDGGGGGGNDGGRDAMANTGPGPRWLRDLGAGTGPVAIGGANGEVVAAIPFASTLAIDGASFTGMATQASTGVVRYTVSGAVRWTAVLDATTKCEIDDLAMRTDDAILVGHTAGTMTASLGLCSVTTTGPTDPIALRIDSSGVPHPVAHWVGSGAASKATHTAIFSTGRVAMSGEYGSALTIGAPLTAAGADPNGFVTSFADNMTTPDYAASLAGAARITGGPVADGGSSELCAQGTYDAAVTLLGTPLAHNNATDLWFMRLQAGGNPRYVINVSSTASDTIGSIIPAAGSGCMSSIEVPADVVIGTSTLPLSAGRGVLLGLDGGGSVIVAIRLPNVAQLVVLGAKRYGALDVTNPLTIGGVPYTPQGSDVIVVELDSTGLLRLVAAFGGAGNQHVDHMAAIATDAVAISLTSTGELTFGTDRIDSGATTIHAIASLGM